MSLKVFYCPEASDRFLYKAKKAFIKLFLCVCRLLFIDIVLTANHEKCSVALELLPKDEIP